MQKSMSTISVDSIGFLDVGGSWCVRSGKSVSLWQLRPNELDSPMCRSTLDNITQTWIASLPNIIDPSDHGNDGSEYKLSTEVLDAPVPTRNTASPPHMKMWKRMCCMMGED